MSRQQPHRRIEPTATAVRFFALMVMLIGPIAAVGQTSAWGQSHSECVAVPTPNHHDAICEALRPRLRVDANFVAFDRITASSRLLMQSTVNTAAQVNADQFNFDFEAGLDLSAAYVCWDDSAWEFRFLGLGEMTADSSTDMGNTQVQVNSTPPVQAPNVLLVNSRYESELFGFEINYHYPLYHCATALAGFRFMSLEDRLDSDLTSVPQSHLYNIRTQNRMYGGQLGLIGHPWFFNDFCSLQGFGKVGIFGNDARHQSLFSTNVSSLGIRESVGQSSVIGEIGFRGQFHFSRRFSAHAGYSLLFLERIVVASDQTSVSDFFNSTGIHDRGSAVFHGASFGVVFTH